MTKPAEVAIVAHVSDELRSALVERYGAADDLSAADPKTVRVLVTSGTVGAGRAMIEQLPALKLIAVFGVGLDRVDLSCAASRGVAVCNTPDVLTDDVADQAVALLYAAARRVVSNDSFVRSGEWRHGRRAPLGRKVTGRRIGIVGLGRIGGAIARRLEPVASAIGYHNRRPVTGSCSYLYHPSAKALAEASDVLILSAAVESNKPPIVTADVLEALGRDGIFINVARGSAVDELALAKALREERLLAAGLDVFANEPNVSADLLSSDRAVLAPHMASATTETRAAMARLVLASLAAFFEGGPLPNEVLMPSDLQPSE